MKKIILFLCVAFLCSFSFSSSTLCEKQQSVWVCSNTATYHKTSSCIDIKNCRGTKKLVSMSEATKAGKTACGICYPQKKSSSASSSTTQQATAKKQAKKTTTNTTPSNSSSTTKKQAKKTTK